MSKTEDEITQELVKASQQMLDSLNNDDLADQEKQEWYGYIRALRDTAYFMGVLNETKIDSQLQQALQHVISPELKQIINEQPHE